jgi:hypothetical protein
MLVPMFALVVYQHVPAQPAVYAYSVVTLGKQQDRLRCQRSLRDREPGRAQAGASINTKLSR